MRALATLLLACAACQSTPTPASVAGSADRLEVEGLPNLGRIHDGLYRGGQPSEEGYRWLAKHGFRTIINLRYSSDETEQVEAHGMTPVRIPLYARLSSEAPGDEQVREFMNLVTDPARHKVYFHCKHGKDRTGTMAAIYRMEVDGWPSAKAIDEMQLFGYHDWYRDLIGYVRGYRPRGAWSSPGR